MDQQPAGESPRKIAKPGKEGKPKRRRRRGFFNLVLIVGIIAAIGLFAWAEQQRRDAVSRLQQTEQELEQIRESTQRRGTEVAQEVLNVVRQYMDIPTDPEPTVATIIDVDALREASEFYNKAKNGDHLIITENRAILYDPDRKIILDVVPVNINQEEQQEIPEGDDTAADQTTGQTDQTQTDSSTEQSDQTSEEEAGQAEGN